MEFNDIALKENALFPFPGDPDGRFKVRIASKGGPEIDKLRRACRPFKSQFEDELDIGRWNDKLANEVILGWEGLFKGDAEVPFSKKAALELLRNVEFATWVSEKASEAKNFVGEGSAAVSKV